jgi:hypothetical protein
MDIPSVQPGSVRDLRFVLLFYATHDTNPAWHSLPGEVSGAAWLCESAIENTALNGAWIIQPHFPVVDPRLVDAGANQP